jgi:hypothetical protein
MTTLANLIKYSDHCSLLKTVVSDEKDKHLKSLTRAIL